MLRPLYLRLSMTLELGIPGFSLTSNRPFSELTHLREALGVILEGCMKY